MSAIIKVDNISKQYRLGQVGTGTISHDINRWWYRLRGREDPYLQIGEINDRSQKGQSDYVWVLQDINFSVQQGEVLGIIGRNGAGKSTLLKILSRTTAPSTGRIKIKGRVASLLEVGTGFHPELSGRENVFLNGAILGMTRQEIKSKFDEIVDFSGVEKYIDTPVKRYSSGMYVRLAFGVAAHLEPEILIVDEVLAVGDAEFQKKALGKMKDVSSSQGRTVLFVSHNMAAVKSICQKGLVLEYGRIAYDGNATNSVTHYLKGDSETQNRKKFSNKYETDKYKLNEIGLQNMNRSDDEPLLENEVIELITNIQIKDANAERYRVTFHLNDESGQGLFSFSHRDIVLRTGHNRLVCKFPASFFQSGTYYLSFFFVEDNRVAVFHEKDIICFTVIDAGRELGVYMGREPGFIRPDFEWENKIA